MDNEFEIFSKMSNLSIRKEFDGSAFKLLYHNLGCDKILARAKSAKMLPYFACSSIKANLDLNVWTPIYEEYKTRNEKVITGLNVIYKALKENGVKKIFLSENFGALLSAGGDPALFASGDVDNCADISESQLISATMKSLGFAEEKRYAGGLYISVEYSNPEILPKGFYFGVQWEPLARLTLPSFVHLDDFVDWRKMRKYGSTSINLPPLDALMYICLLHISLHSFCRAPAVRLYRDIVNCSEGITNQDWKTIINWTKKYKTNSRTSAAAYLANKVAEVPVPNEFLNNLNSKLINIVFNERTGVLREEPDRLKVFFVEMQCNDLSLLSGFKAILFPDKEWMKNVYGDSKISVLKHVLDIL